MSSLVNEILEIAQSREDPAAVPIDQREDLAERVFSGAELSEGERWYLGALLLASKHRRKGRERQREARYREIAIAARLYRIIEGKNYVAVEKAAKAFKVSELTVRTALREQKAEFERFP